jgi:drug/metabolite transporter (DMT)-like permease
MNRFYFLIPTFFDLLTSTMQFVAFNFISASAYQMMKGGSIITTFIFSVTFLKLPILRRQLAGSILAFIGIFIVGLANTIFTSQTSSGDVNVTF